MALWDKITSRGRIEDRRSMAPTAIGGLGLGGIVIYLLASYFLGGQIDVNQVLRQLEDVQIEQSQTQNDNFQGPDQYETFASTVLGSNNDLWQSIFKQINHTYQPPTLVLFRTATQSACGTATSQVGPHYCPLDQTIYLDETFFDELKNQLGAQGGDVAEAYVIAHEVGHHVQNQLGVINRQTNLTDNDFSIKLELQADCYAGLWANSIKNVGVFLPGEINEAMDAAATIGDDRIQEKITGRITPETWTHGSSQQRVNWFTQGYQTGELASCDTFNQE